MSMISISLDTKTRQTSLAVDGVLVPAESFAMDKWM